MKQYKKLQREFKTAVELNNKLNTEIKEKLELLHNMFIYGNEKEDLCLICEFDTYEHNDFNRGHKTIKRFNNIDKIIDKPVILLNLPHDNFDVNLKLTHEGIRIIEEEKEKRDYHYDRYENYKITDYYLTAENKRLIFENYELIITKALEAVAANMYKLNDRNKELGKRNNILKIDKIIKALQVD